jgi:hypothetical protein
MNNHENKDGKHRKYDNEVERHDACLNDIDIKKRSLINMMIQNWAHNEDGR